MCGISVRKKIHHIITGLCCCSSSNFKIPRPTTNNIFHLTLKSQIANRNNYKRKEIKYAYFSHSCRKRVVGPRCMYNIQLRGKQRHFTSTYSHPRNFPQLFFFCRCFWLMEEVQLKRNIFLGFQKTDIFYLIFALISKSKIIKACLYLHKYGGH